ncbi:MAG TPA: DUF1232 domain-containing protein [Longimicrobiales bacterium]
MMRLRRLRRRGGFRVAAALVLYLPEFLRLLVRLLLDPRVSRLDKALLGVVFAYVVIPTDFLPDFLAVLGRIDDLFLLGMALDRLLRRAGPRLLLEHWDADPAALEALVGGLHQLGAALPGRIRRRLVRVLRRAG